MNIKDDITTLRQFLGTIMPAGTIFSLQDTSKTPETGLLCIELLPLNAETTRQITAAHNKVERNFRLIYYGKSNIDVIGVTDLLRKKITNQTKMRVGNGYTAIDAFSASRPFKTESEIDAVIFILQTSFVEKRTFPNVPKMDHIGIKFKL
ncbi:hypothetical protein [Metabacillus fastidiosus]|uniref:hypothetical protein n=1 Tax=Metabacillus fastidiosus TaxID=1458 RepID=UPI002E1F91FB|nr:hypothetical protein [Metabacillus fastidiosus]